MAKIIIEYKGHTAPECRHVDSICPVFLPTNSYVDGAGMEGSIYDTNVQGMGKFDTKGFIANLCIPFPGAIKYFNMAVVDGKVELDVTDYKEILFFKELKAQMGADWDIIIEEGAEKGE